MSYLEIRDLDKKYDSNGKLVVDKMNLSIEKGEFVVFLGPSGCGKTTTIRMISGLETITSGEIFIDGTNVANLPPKDRGVSMIFQSYAVWPHMTVYDNIAYPLKIRKMKKAEIEERVKLASEKADITEFLKRYPSQLSGGQRQRVAVARAIVVEPKIFLMDEPLSNLDAMLRVSMRTELKKIHTMLGATTIFVTHDQAEAMSLADKIVIMKDGKIEQIGTAKEVYNDCETMFVASFIGAPPTNFFDITVTKNKENLVGKNQNVEFCFDKEKHDFVEKCIDEEIVLGIRPEKIDIDTEKQKGAFAKCVAEFVEPQGPHNIVITTLGGKTVKIVSTKEIACGQVIYLSVNDDSFMLFDKTSGKRIR